MGTGDHHVFPPVQELAASLADGRLSSRDLVQLCMARIDRLNGFFNAVRCVADDAESQAEASDRRRRSGRSLGPLDGVPVLVKDNIDVRGMTTTAGSLALSGCRPTVDAHLIDRLRRSGAVVLGKTNLSELANFLTEDMPSGYSSLGGQVLNPYDVALTPSGSSSGSAAAVALGLVPLAVGTETDGSITSPAAHQSLVGFKPTVGLVSRSGVIPIAPSQDTAGPMTATVADAAALLAALAGPDDGDPATDAGEETAVRLRTWTADPLRLAGSRLAVARGCEAEEDPDAGRAFASALDALAQAGAGLVDRSLDAPDSADEMFVLHYEFAPAFDRYLAGLGEGATRRSLREVRDWNTSHPVEALKYGQQRVETAVAIDHAVRHAEYLRRRARHRAQAESKLDEAVTGCDAVVFPAADGATWAARAGWPSVALPAGYLSRSRRPFAVTVVAKPWTDDRLLSLAAAVESVLPARRPPWELNPAVFSRL